MDLDHRQSRAISRRRFLHGAGTAALILVTPGLQRAATAESATRKRAAHLAFLRALAREVLEGCKVSPGGRIPDGPTNATGYTLRVPGATQNYYPAFWIRDAAMMLGGGFIPAEEIAGWIQVVAASQPGPDGLRFGRLRIPPFSIPDHITLAGEACWFPGAYTEQGNGAYGFLPPADDAYYFIHMVYEHWRLSRRLELFRSPLKTGWGNPTLAELCRRAFDSVDADPWTGLVICEAAEERTRVDWGFCDTIRKTGLCLMPSLLRWRAARQLADLFAASGDSVAARRFRSEASKVGAAIAKTFFREVMGPSGVRTGLLLSATELGRKDDVWAAAFAVWLGALPRNVERVVAQHLAELAGGTCTVVEGQVRHLPPSGEFGGFWEQASCPRGEYQNGGYWATPTGWLIAALRKVDMPLADRTLSDLVNHLREHREAGAPWEWISPQKSKRVNPRYAASVGLVCVALEESAK